MSRMIVVTVGALLVAASTLAAGLEPVQLPKAVTEGGMPLMEALMRRATARSFAPDPIPAQTLSNLLWAAWGINRPDGKRTAPSALNWQEIELYVIMEKGAYRYDAAAQVLEPVAGNDLRHLAGQQPFVKEAPLTLVMVADRERMSRGPESEKDVYAAADAAFISQNVYLFCASEKLATGVRAAVDKAALAQALNLSPSRRVIFAQSVGYPKK